MADEFDQYARKPQSSQRDDFAQYARKPEPQVSQSQSPPTAMDRISSEVNQGGKVLDPESVVHGIGDSLGRTTKAWGDMFSGNANAMTPAEMIPLIGPAAVDAGRNLADPTRRLEGMTDAAMLLSPGLRELPESRPLNFADGDVPTPGVVSRVGAGVRAAAPSVSKGAAKMATGGAIDLAVPGAGHAAVLATYPLMKSGFNDIGRGIRSGIDAFRGPVQGPEVATKGFQSPYPTLPYERPLPAMGPRPAFEGHDFTPRVFENSEPVGQPGAALPSGSVVGPAPPSRVNPPPPSGNAPRVPGWQRMPITGEPLPGRDLSPVYPSSPILESGRVIGPRHSLTTEPNRGTVVNGPAPPPVATKPAMTQPELDTLNQQLRDSLKARGVAPLVDTPGDARGRANSSRAKFDENGKRNQLKSK